MGVYFAAFSSLLPHFHWSTVSHVRFGRLHRRNCEIQNGIEEQKGMYKLINLNDKLTRIDQRIKSEMMNLNTKCLEK